MESRLTPYATLANGMPILNSLPTAPASIFMDFDGHTDEYLSFSVDADHATFNLEEQTHIHEAWRQLSQYYAMFHVNVTTIEPAANHPKAWALISPSINGGYSGVGAFPNNRPVSFNNQGDGIGRVSGIAHEVGHNFGIGHQATYDLLGNMTREYAFGLDPWHGPLMGVDFDGVVHKWIIGHPDNNPSLIDDPAPSLLLDDVAIIAGELDDYGGDGFRPDEHGNTLATATALTVSGTDRLGTGIIERLTDADLFSFQIASAGRYLIASTPEYPSGIELKHEILDSAGNLLASASDGRNAQRTTLQLAAGTYYLRISSIGNYGDLGSYNVRVTPGMADGWLATDVGVVGKSGTSAFDPATGTFSITGSGDDIWGRDDAFQFAYQALTGDGSITARVTSLTNTHPWAKVGLMMRSSLDESSAYVMAMMTPENGFAVHSRAQLGNNATSRHQNSALDAPIWIRLTRAGNTITALRSADGITWTQASQFQLALGETVLIGLAVTSHVNEEERAMIGTSDTPTMATATFNNVAFTGSINARPATNALAAPTGVAVTLPPAGSGLRIAWNAVASATGYTVERSLNGVDFVTIGTTEAGVTNFLDADLPGSHRYFYRVRANDATGVSTASAIVHRVNRPSSVTSFTVTSWRPDKLILNWRETTGETGYRIERSGDGGATFQVVGNVGANIPSYTDTGLMPGTNYQYRVIPTSDIGDGDLATGAGNTRLPAPTNLTLLTAPNVVLTWTAIPGASSYTIERSLDGVTFTTLSSDTTEPQYTDNTTTPLTGYTYRVYANGPGGEIGAMSRVMGATPGVLPAGWQNRDVGNVGGPGASGATNGTFTLVGSGNDIWDRADGFHFTYQTLTGDGSITARVSGLTDQTADSLDGWAKTGLMMRTSLDANSPYIMAMITGSNGVSVQSRSAVNNFATNNSTIAGINAPIWLRLVRAGNTVTAFRSTDGETWTQITQLNINLGQTIFIGMAGMPHNNLRYLTATFDHVTLSNRTPTISSVASATPNPVTMSTTTAVAVQANDDFGERNLIYSWSLVSGPAGAPEPSFSENASNAAKNATITFLQAGSYTFRVTITDLGGLQVTSDVVVNVQSRAQSLSISPSSPTLLIGAQQPFTVTGVDQFGQPVTVTWSATAGSITSDGLFTSPQTAQTVIVTAQGSGGSATASITVQTPPAPPTPPTVPPTPPVVPPTPPTVPPTPPVVPPTPPVTPPTPPVVPPTPPVVPPTPPVVPPTPPVVPPTPPTLPPTLPRPGPMLVGMPGFATGADRPLSSVFVYRANGEVAMTKEPFPGRTGGVRVALGDVNGDGVPDLIAGAGPGGTAQIVVFDGASQQEIARFDAFESAFIGGVYVATGDLDGDGLSEVVVTPDEGGGPVVAVYSGAALRQGIVTELTRFFGIQDPSFRGGARPAMGDVSGDGQADIVVSAGFLGGPRIQVWDANAVLMGRTGNSDTAMANFFAFEQTLRNGVFVAVGDVNGDGHADLILGGGPGGGPRVRIADGAQLLRAGDFGSLDLPPAQSLTISNFFAGDVTNRGGVRVGVADLDGDERADLVVGSGPAAGSKISTYRGSLLTTMEVPTAFDEFSPFGGFTGGVFVG
ncbi:FG-GAP-like repeat-containing protein [Tuwongella immobilis]|uniref:FG-GAP-like repeat-containing protein n=1 Tax=Tuwongella immobilis TaxID=692036 RepID=UPI0013A6E3A5|nr:FG-GAP-like repeat-containing protein [Tuwongella immobilis]